MQIYKATIAAPFQLQGFIDRNDIAPINVYYGAPLFTASTLYKVWDIVRPTTANGYYYRCVKAGLSSTEPTAWRSHNVTGLATFYAVNYNLFIEPAEVLTNSVWEASDGVTLTTPTYSEVSTRVVISAIPAGITSFILTNTVTKTGGFVLVKKLKLFIG